MQTDTLLADIREFVERHATKEQDKFLRLSTKTDADTLLERIDARLNLPSWEGHDWELHVHADDEDSTKITGSLHTTNKCDNNSCACHGGSFTEYGLLEEIVIPVRAKWIGGKYNSWSGDYDDTYIELTTLDSEKITKAVELAMEGLGTDGSHHKQWYFFEIIKALGGVADPDHYDEGIAP